MGKIAQKPAPQTTNPFGNLMITSEDSGAFLNEGTHEVTITDVVASTPKSPGFKDPHKQVQVVFKDENGKQISEWYNIVGYSRYDDLSVADKKSGRFINRDGYAVDNTTQMRVVDAERSQKAVAILGTLGLHAGIPKGAQFQATDLVDRTVTIVVGRVVNPAGGSQLRVIATRGEAVEAEATNF